MTEFGAAADSSFVASRCELMKTFPGSANEMRSEINRKERTRKRRCLFEGQRVLVPRQFLAQTPETGSTPLARIRLKILVSLAVC